MKSTKGNDTATSGSDFSRLVFFGSITISIISIVFSVCLIERGGLGYYSLGCVAISLATNMIYTSLKRVVSKNNQSS